MAKKSTKSQKTTVQPLPPSESKIALCYIRLSYTSDDDDTNSPARQRHNIERFCQRHGFTPEWFEDVGGHRSGRSEENRPEWLRLKMRLGDGDVAALVANDLSRFHRNMSKVYTMLDEIEQYGIPLGIASSDLLLDVTGVQGRLMTYVTSMFDDFYARDIAAKARESIEYRKRQGITIGIPPFGTVRDKDGYLIPSKEGAWCLPNGTFVVGNRHESPAEGAMWRSYYAAAEHVLRIYVETDKGMEKIAYQLNEEGFAYRNRDGLPRLFNREDIRRIIALWKVYGGLPSNSHSKETPGYGEDDVDMIELISERCIFPIELLKAVGQARKNRARHHRDHGVKHNAYPYALTLISYCAHCERLAEQHNNPQLRTTFTGHIGRYNARRYRHRDGIDCGVINRTVLCTDMEAEFIRLIRALEIKKDYMELMIELAIQIDKARGIDNQDIEEKKRNALMMCERRMNATIDLYKQGLIDKLEFERTREQILKEKAYWEHITTDREEIEYELLKCIQLLTNIEALWEKGSPIDKQTLARELFDKIVFDLDTKRIVSFELKPWAQRFLILRATLHNDEKDGPSDENKKSRSNLLIGNELSPRGLEPLSSP